MSAFKEVDMEDLAKKFDACMSRNIATPSAQDVPVYSHIIERILSKDQDYLKHEVFRKMLRTHKCIVKNSFLFQVFLLMKRDQSFHLEDEKYIRRVLQIKSVKSHSGINSITVFTSGQPEWIDKETGETRQQNFSCRWNCSFCPSEPGQPKSYLSLEPGVLRANRNNFDCVSQIHDRMKALYLCGHDCDKLELLVLGGTWTSYPVAYREEFIRDIYFAANVFWDFLNESMPLRERRDLDEEKQINKTATSKVIGLTLETRPDTITAKELKLLRYYGCTRVQLGIQHLDDAVLEKNNRKCKTSTTIKAIKILKDCGFKIDGHFIPNLPGSSLEKDVEMFRQLLTVVNQSNHTYTLLNEDVQVDQWKVYPCTIVPYTDIEKWYKDGSYVPYSKDAMKTMLLDMKANVFPWIRLNRIVRDIPDHYSFDPEYNSNLRQSLAEELKLSGRQCKCVRCREIKRGDFHDSDCYVVVRQYNASGGMEFFISFESQDNSVLYGFVRLRLTKTQPLHIFPELEDCALIRELHVYGNLQAVNTEGCHVQHKGLGQKLLAIAEEIAIKNNFNRMSVIAGEGTREYYEKRGYIDNFGQGRFMMKTLTL